MTTIYNILEDYPTVNDITEFLDSDILILPNKKFHKDDNVKTTIVHGNLNNNCQINVFEGNGFDVSKDILSLKDS